MSRHTILIIDDDLDLCASIKNLLEQRDYKTILAHDSNNIESIINSQAIDLILLDIILPGGKDGISLCKLIRDLTSAPIIMLSGVEADAEKIISLELGADNYITKPFNSRVLLAHINAALRRKVSPNESEANLVNVQYELFEFQGFRLNVTARALLSPDNQLIKLTSAEFFLLHALLRHPQCVLTRDQLLSFINVNSGSLDRSVDILISRIRSKLGQYSNLNLITTIRSSGYLLASCVNKQTMDSHAWQDLTFAITHVE